ncbi:type IV secretion protein Rhs [Neisseria perflava]|uniref:type IV secretion protein Rhs n=1 Tax=Neisseria perflava TaxID=33053 RepID=UPI00209D60DA|nr:type IV secretion protein Rhs [Neisseria perflava]MCP1660718.1 hypothetical protein [Neisseria perflava]
MAKHWRHLTELEIAAARRIFSDGIDYPKVRIYRGIPYLPNLSVAVSPNGHIYFPRRNCPPDFVLESANHQVWLIHELTHVWQYQNGYRTWLAGLRLFALGGYFRRRAYRYPQISSICHFSDLNMEQQADMLAHYYTACYLPCSAYAPKRADFQTALSGFLENPCQKAWLPKGWANALWQTVFRRKHP